MPGPFVSMGGEKMEANIAARSDPTLEDRVHKALVLWHKGASLGSPLADLLIVQQALVAAGGNLRLATNQVLLQALSHLADQHADEASLLRVRFLDGKTVHLLAIERNLAEATIYVQQHRAIGLLAAVVQDMEQGAGTSRRTIQENRLPLPTYSSLVGMEGHLGHLLHLLTAGETPRIVLLDGIGGVGKTALADALLRRLIARGSFADVAWVSAQRQFYHVDGALRQVPRATPTADSFVDELAKQLLSGRANGLDQGHSLALLRTHLAQTPHLVVLDSLDVVTDIDQLLALLLQIAGRSRFLLISRHRFHAEPGVYHFRLPELGEANALRLVRQEAALRNLPDLVAASDATLQPIYATVGGNPLALRLVVGQVHIHPLPMILDDLAAAQGESVEALYTYIYRHAWDSLDDLCRRVLLAMPLVSERGGSLELLAEISQLRPNELRRALAELVNLNLLDSCGDLQQRCYSIHNLTRSFLLEQVVRWKL